VRYSLRSDKAQATGVRRLRHFFRKIKATSKKKHKGRWTVRPQSRSSPTGFEEKILMCLFFRGQNFFFKNLASVRPATRTERFLFFLFFLLKNILQNIKPNQL